MDGCESFGWPVDFPLLVIGGEVWDGDAKTNLPPDREAVWEEGGWALLEEAE